MLDPCIIADILRTECDRQGRSLRDVCRAAGVSHTSVLWWGGTARREPSLPSLRVLVRICAELGLRTSDVLRAAES